jgi:hypothetical protein
MESITQEEDNQMLFEMTDQPEDHADESVEPNLEFNEKLVATCNSQGHTEKGNPAILPEVYLTSVAVEREDRPQPREINEDVYKQLADDIIRTGKIPEKLKAILENENPDAVHFELEKLNELLEKRGMKVEFDRKSGAVTLHRKGVRLDRHDVERMKGHGGVRPVPPALDELLVPEVKEVDAVPVRKEENTLMDLMQELFKKQLLSLEVRQAIAEDSVNPLLPSMYVTKDRPKIELGDSDLIKHGRDLLNQWKTNAAPFREKITEVELNRLRDLDPSTWLKLRHIIKMTNSGYIG